MNKLSLSLFLLSITRIQAFELSDESNICYKVIQYLSQHDAQLSTRYDNKKRIASQSSDANQFFQNMETSGIIENGTAYACGLTRSYVSEVFAGLKFQYTEVLDQDPPQVAYQEYIGQDIVDLFQTNAESTNHFIYQIKHIGTQDHDFVVEQLPSNAGYRIYQSYHDAYSLKAWLSNDTDYDSLFQEGDLMIFSTVQAQMNSSLVQLTRGAISLNNLQDLPPILNMFKPYLEFVRDYNESQVIENFKNAQDIYGKGKILSKEEFFAPNGYLESTKILSEYFKEYDGTWTKFSQSQWDLWIQLYGSPDPIYYPNLPNKAIAGDVIGNATYSCQIKVVDLGSSESNLARNCLQNGRIIEAAVRGEVNEEAWFSQLRNQ